MDLLSCPKCGDAWRKGAEKCLKCGFVPIGVGLDKIKKKKKRVGRYVEPGSWRGFLSFGTLAGVMTFCAVKQPWTDDWEMFRSLIGQGRHHSVVGEWEIVKTVAVDKSKAVITAQRVNRGTLVFNDKGSVKFSLKGGKQQTEAQGDYVVAGTSLAVRKLSTLDGATWQMPATLNISLAWTGPNSLVASCNGAEALYLRRAEKGRTNTLVQVGLKSESGEAAPGLQNLAGKMTTGTDKD